MKNLILIIILAAASPSAFARQSVDRTGYLDYNGRCPNFGIALHDQRDEENPSGTCVVFPALENIPTTDDAKLAAIAALVNIKVRVIGLEAANSVIEATSITLK